MKLISSLYRKHTHPCWSSPSPPPPLLPFCIFAKDILQSFCCFQYSECLCIRNTNLSMSHVAKEPLGNATIGYCDLECDNFVWYIILFSIFVFIHSTSEVGSMLLILRCVDPRDKAMALGLIQFAIGLFGKCLPR